MLKIPFKVGRREILLIALDDRNFSIGTYQTVIDKTTKKEVERWMAEGYFHNLTHALEELLRLKIMHSEAKDLKSLIEDVKKIQQEIRDATALER